MIININKWSKCSVLMSTQSPNSYVSTHEDHSSLNRRRRRRLLLSIQFICVVQCLILCSHFTECTFLAPSTGELLYSINLLYNIVIIWESEGSSVQASSMVILLVYRNVELFLLNAFNLKHNGGRTGKFKTTRSLSYLSLFYYHTHTHRTLVNILGWYTNDFGLNLGLYGEKTGLTLFMYCCFLKSDVCVICEVAPSTL